MLSLRLLCKNELLYYLGIMTVLFSTLFSRYAYALTDPPLLCKILSVLVRFYCLP
jgi:hypothetical protein